MSCLILSLGCFKSSILTNESIKVSSIFPFSSIVLVTFSIFINIFKISLFSSSKMLVFLNLITSLKKSVVIKFFNICVNSREIVSTSIFFNFGLNKNNLDNCS